MAFLVIVTALLSHISYHQSFMTTLSHSKDLSPAWTFSSLELKNKETKKSLLNPEPLSFLGSNSMQHSSWNKVARDGPEEEGPEGVDEVPDDDKKVLAEPLGCFLHQST
ncbi:hypothetical protein QOT17_004528 [Balamuthia mandrillaris]